SPSCTWRRKRTGRPSGSGCFPRANSERKGITMSIKNKNLNLPIAIISIVIPGVVAILFYLPRPEMEAGFNVQILPLFHAILNSATAVLLLASLYFIKNGHAQAHKVANLTAVVLSTLFLVSYVTYHF